MEYLSYCPLCEEGEKPARFLDCPDHLLGTSNYSMVKCNSCHHIYTNPRPFEKDLEKFYKSQKYISHTEQASSFRDYLYFRVRAYMLGRKAKLIRKLNIPNHRLLDVGCGTGAFLKKMEESHFQVIGVEPNMSASKMAIEKGLQVFENQQYIKEIGENSLGVITLWHVLEHQPDFMQGLQQYFTLLIPGGWLVVAVPQHQSFDAGFYRQYWAAYDLPRHLHHFSFETLLLACRKNGFAFRKKIGMPFDAFYVALLSEQFKGTPLGAVRAILVAAWSNLLALLRVRPWSSQIFIFQKSF